MFWTFVNFFEVWGFYYVWPSCWYFSIFCILHWWSCATVPSCCYFFSLSFIFLFCWLFLWKSKSYDGVDTHSSSEHWTNLKICAACTSLITDCSSTRCLMKILPKRTSLDIHFCFVVGSFWYNGRDHYFYSSISSMWFEDLTENPTHFGSVKCQKNLHFS